MVVVVLDSVSINHLLRRPTKSRIGKELRYGTSLDVHIAERRVKLAIDGARALVDEWQRTSEPEAVKVALIEWESRGGILPIEKVGRYNVAQSKFLKAAGFTDTCDKLVLRISLATPNRTIVSDDSDFWDPKNRKNFGIKNAPVCKFLRQALQVTVYMLGAFMKIAPALLPNKPQSLDAA